MARANDHSAATMIISARLSGSRISAYPVWRHAPRAVSTPHIRRNRPPPGFTGTGAGGMRTPSVTRNLARSARPNCRPSQSAATRIGRPIRNSHSVPMPTRASPTIRPKASAPVTTPAIR